jgi:hypothetical protein
MPEDTISKVELRRMMNGIKMKKSADPVRLFNQISEQFDTVNIRRLQPFRKEPAANHGGECSMRTSRRANKRRKLNN